MKARFPDDDPQVREGKQSIEQCFSSKGAARFDWTQDFGNSNWSLKFNHDGASYMCEIGHVSLTNLKNDPKRDENIEALWKSRQ